jgi:hypothetical protein
MTTEYLGEPGAYGIRAVDPATPGAIICGHCGAAWMQDITPAGRCPWEDEHEDGPTEPTFTVYALIDGIVDGEDSCDDFAAAAIQFAQVVADYTELADRGELTADVTVHLYHPSFGVMEAERHISASA